MTTLPTGQLLWCKTDLSMSTDTFTSRRKTGTFFSKCDSSTTLTPLDTKVDFMNWLLVVRPLFPILAFWVPLNWSFVPNSLNYLFFWVTVDVSLSCKYRLITKLLQGSFFRYKILIVFQIFKHSSDKTSSHLIKETLKVIISETRKYMYFLI